MKKAGFPGEGEAGLQVSSFYYANYSSLGEFLRFSQSVIFCLNFRRSRARDFATRDDLPERCELLDS